MERIHVYVTGLVQGVGFRYYAKKKASEAGVCGWVKNLSDGRVEIIAEGEETAVEAFLQSLSGGRLGSHIEDMRKSREPYTGSFNHFYISYNEDFR